MKQKQQVFLRVGHPKHRGALFTVFSLNGFTYSSDSPYFNYVWVDLDSKHLSGRPASDKIDYDFTADDYDALLFLTDPEAKFHFLKGLCNEILSNSRS
jgi:hypothetical protein